MAHLHRLQICCLLLLLAAAPARPLAAPGADRAADARRLLTLLAGVSGEYREAFDEHGRLVRTIQLEGAKLLLAEARDLNGRLDAIDAARLDAIGAQLDAHTLPVATFETDVRGIAAAVSERTGVRDEPMPPAPPSAAGGGALFGDNCAGGHAPNGA